MVEGRLACVLTHINMNCTVIKIGFSYDITGYLLLPAGLMRTGDTQMCCSYMLRELCAESTIMFTQVVNSEVGNYGPYQMAATELLL